MKKNVLLALSFLTFSSAFAATTNSDAKVNTEIKSIERSILNESLANREGKKYLIDAAVTGIDFGAQSKSLELGYYLDANNIATLKITSMTAIDQDSTGYSYDEDAEKKLWSKDGKGSAVYAGLKHFASNSFYVAPAIYSRSQQFVNSISFSGGYIIDSSQGKINDVGASVKIGNQWQWKNFTLGCDWVGFSTSLAGSKSGDVLERHKSTISALNFYMGASF